MRWVSSKELEKLPFSSAQNKLREWVLKGTDRTVKTGPMKKARRPFRLTLEGSK
jgi:hypothetical protein